MVQFVAHGQWSFERWAQFRAVSEVTLERKAGLLLSIKTQPTCISRHRGIYEPAMDPDNVMQLLVGLFLVFGRGFIVGRIKDPTRRIKIDRLLKVTGPIVLGCAVFVAVAGFMRRDQQLEKVAQAVNLSAPKIVDEVTRLERATAGPGRRLTYHMTISISEAEFDRAGWKQKTLPAIRTNTLEQDATRTLLNAGITVVIRYSSKEGAYLEETIFTSSDLPKN